MKLTKTSGSCPEIPEQLFSQPDTSPGSDAGCHVTTNNAMCSLQITCKETVAMTTTQVSGTASFAAAAVTGTVTVTVTNSDASPGCTGTYNLTATKR